MKVDIVTGDDIKIYYTGKFQDFTARCIIDMTELCFEWLQEASVFAKGTSEVIKLGQTRFNHSIPTFDNPKEKAF